MASENSGNKYSALSLWPLKTLNILPFLWPPKTPEIIHPAIMQPTARKRPHRRLYSRLAVLWQYRMTTGAPGRLKRVLARPGAKMPFLWPPKTPGVKRGLRNRYTGARCRPGIHFARRVHLLPLAAVIPWIAVQHNRGVGHGCLFMASIYSCRYIL